MNLHGNAKTTPAMRRLIVDRVTRLQWTQRQAADAVGVSVRTVATWLRRWRDGDHGLADRSSRPHRSPRQLAAGVIDQILALRRTRATAWAISTAVRVPRSTVTRVLSRAGLNRVASLEPPVPVQRYEWPAAGDLLHLDIKPLGRIRGIGHRITGDRRGRPRGIGWEYVHVAIDDATRLAYVEVLRTQRKRATQAFLRRALQWYHRRGIRVCRILTDNGGAYHSQAFAQTVRSWRLRHRFTRPFRPQTNGKAERFIQTLLREWAYQRPFTSSALRTKALTRYVRYYNHRRPHASLGRRSPWTRFQVGA